jgi:hypothetical protein
MEARNAEIKHKTELADSDNVTLKSFEEKTNPDIREHVFSKWIKQELQRQKGLRRGQEDVLFSGWKCLYRFHK